MVDKLFYNVTLSQTLSPCGNYLLAGNIYGEISVFNLQLVIDPGDEVSKQSNHAMFKFSVPNQSQVCSLVSSPEFLIAGTIGEIVGFDWKNIKKLQNPKILWSILIPILPEALEKAEMNSLVLKPEDGHLYAGCGDNRIYSFSLEDGKLIRSIEAHDDYIHEISIFGNQMASASEDGLVKLWDSRQKFSSNQISPHLNDKVGRPELGKWVGAVSISDDWLLCGGGPSLSLWNMRSLSMMTPFPLEDNGIHVARFYDDHVMAGGSSPVFRHLDFSGKIISEVPSSSISVYTEVHQESPYNVMCLAGSSSKIDLCTNFYYRDQILSLECKT